jgi:hypothetical protein
MVLPGAVVLAAPAAANMHLSLAKVNTPIWAQPGQFLSYNWAGYAAYDQANGSVTRVSGTWTEPAVTCPAKGVALAAFWVGIDGFTSPTVEQDGSLAYCHGGTASYYAWWEMYPTNDIQVISSIAVSAGDVLTGSVVYHPSLYDFTLSITDKTTGASFAVTAAQAPAYAAYALENSAECIIERPAFISGSGAITLSHLADFGSVSFSSCRATVSHFTSGVGNFAPAAIIYMIGESSTLTHIVYLASPGGPTNILKWAFPTAWQRAH